jgi:hypothetical protein
METGIHGIAISGLITQSANKKKKSLNNLKTTLYANCLK